MADLIPNQRRVIAGEAFDPHAIDHILTWRVPRGLADLRNLKTVFSVGAEVDQFLGAELPEGVKLARPIAPGLAAMMQEYVTMAMLALHRHMPAYIDQRQRQVWKMAMIPPPAETVRVGVMGLGELGRAALEALKPFASSWPAGHAAPTASPASIAATGRRNWTRFLAPCDHLVCPLPLTFGTEGILNADLFARLPRGACLVQIRRGRHLVQEDLLAALDSGQISAAVLDVTGPEPPPQDQPFCTDRASS